MDKEIKKFYSGKRILVTGAAGTVGREIVNLLYSLDCEELRLVDNNETEMFFLMEEYKDTNVTCFLGDIRDRDKIEKLTNGVDIIIHSAAFKHVILSEFNPFDVVQTNIMGVENIIRAAYKHNIKYVVFTSSDKAVNPTNVMGTSKLMGEKLITAANAVNAEIKTVFSSTRFGNVLGSRGSVVPVFMKQIKKGGPVTITDRRMTRFIMTKAQAASLVLTSCSYSKGGEVFVTKMPAVKISDLAQAMIEILAPVYGYDPYAIDTVEIGAKPGEKHYEELLSEEETYRALELDDMFAVLPAFKSSYKSINYNYLKKISDCIEKPYKSSTEKLMTLDETKKFLMQYTVLEDIEESLFRG